jgi:hypothetical protein
MSSMKVIPVEKADPVMLGVARRSWRDDAELAHATFVHTVCNFCTYHKRSPNEKLVFSEFDGLAEKRRDDQEVTTSESKATKQSNHVRPGSEP